MASLCWGVRSSSHLCSLKVCDNDGEDDDGEDEDDFDDDDDDDDDNDDDDDQSGNKHTCYASTSHSARFLNII